MAHNAFALETLNGLCRDMFLGKTEINVESVTSWFFSLENHATRISHADEQLGWSNVLNIGVQFLGEEAFVARTMSAKFKSILMGN